MIKCKDLHMTFELIRIWIRIPIQVIKHLEIGVNLENGVIFYPQFVDSVSNYNLLHIITLGVTRQRKRQSIS